MTQDNFLCFCICLTFCIKWTNQGCFAHHAVALMIADDIVSPCIFCEGSLLQTSVFTMTYLFFTMICLLGELRRKLK